MGAALYGISGRESSGLTGDSCRLQTTLKRGGSEFLRRESYCSNTGTFRRPSRTQTVLADTIIQGPFLCTRGISSPAIVVTQKSYPYLTSPDLAAPCHAIHRLAAPCHTHPCRTIPLPQKYPCPTMPRRTWPRLAVPSHARPYLTTPLPQIIYES